MLKGVLINTSFGFDISDVQLLYSILRLWYDCGLLGNILY